MIVAGRGAYVIKPSPDVALPPSPRGLVRGWIVSAEAMTRHPVFPQVAARLSLGLSAPVSVIDIRIAANNCSIRCAEGTERRCRRSQGVRKAVEGERAVRQVDREDPGGRPSTLYTDADDPLRGCGCLYASAPSFVHHDRCPAGCGLADKEHMSILQSRCGCLPDPCLLARECQLLQKNKIPIIAKCELAERGVEERAAEPSNIPGEGSETPLRSSSPPSSPAQRLAEPSFAILGILRPIDRLPLRHVEM